MDLNEIRKEIDGIDDQLVTLFKKRMELVKGVKEYKERMGLPVFHPQRERDILNRITEGESETQAMYLKALFSTLFAVSKSYQSDDGKDSPFKTKIKDALKDVTAFPIKASVACQGVDGAYSSIAATKLFALPDILFFKNFDGVFNAVEKGLCKFGVLPIENSSYGSVADVYDLMRKHSFHIVKAVKVHISHCLLAKKNISLDEIKTVYTHTQAIGQCSEFLKSLKNAKIVACENTAVAAKMVAESEDDTVTAIASQSCAELYGLKILSKTLSNTANNYTRFILISKDLKIYSGATKLSLMLSLKHKAGALYDVMSKFYALSLNLTKIESRPIVGSDFEFMFYFDVEASLDDERVINLLESLSKECEQFVFLGGYSEI